MDDYLPFQDWAIREMQFDTNLTTDSCKRKWLAALQNDEVRKKQIGGVWCIHVLLSYCGPSAAEHSLVRGHVHVCARAQAASSGGLCVRPALGSVVSKFVQAKATASLRAPSRPGA